MTRNEGTGEPDAGTLGTSGSEGSGRKRSGSATSPATYPTSRSIAPLFLRLLAVLALLGCPRIGSAAGTWSVISLPQQPGQVIYPTALAVDAAGTLYVGDQAYPACGNSVDRVQRRDAQGNWSVLAPHGTGLGQVHGSTALAVDAMGNLYVADSDSDTAGQYLSRIQKRDAQGNWSLIATPGSAIGQVSFLSALAVDAAGNLYVFDYGGGPRIQKRDAQGNWSVIANQQASALAADAAGNLYVAAWYFGSDSRIQKRDTQGNWSLIATPGDGPGQVVFPTALAVDGAGTLYVAEHDDAGNSRIQRRDAQGNWSLFATQGDGLGQINGPSALAVDTAGNLYVADYGANGPRIQKRDARGNWFVIATEGGHPGQLFNPTGLAVDPAGNLYVADGPYDPATRMYSDRIQKRDAQGNWSVLATSGTAIGQVSQPHALAVDAAGTLYVADQDDAGNSRIQRRDAQGNWSAIANFSGALAVDTAGTLYVAGDAIQKRDAQGNWSVIATEGTDLGQVGRASAIAVDAAGDLYVAERRFDPYCEFWGIDRILKWDA